MTTTTETVQSRLVVNDLGPQQPVAGVIWHHEKRAHPVVAVVCTHEPGPAAALVEARARHFF